MVYIQYILCCVGQALMFFCNKHLCCSYWVILDALSKTGAKQGRFFLTFNPSPAEPDIPCLYKQCIEEANWSGSALFTIKYMNLYQQTRSSNQIGWTWKKAWHLDFFSRTRVKALSKIIADNILFFIIIFSGQLLHSHSLVRAFTFHIQIF